MLGWASAMGPQMSERLLERAMQAWRGRNLAMNNTLKFLLDRTFSSAHEKVILHKAGQIATYLVHKKTRKQDCYIYIYIAPTRSG